MIAHRLAVSGSGRPREAGVDLNQGLVSPHLPDEGGARVAGRLPFALWC